MKTKMIKTLIPLSVFLFVGIGLYAQDTTTINATTESIGENLDLEAVASVFGDSKDLEDFEKRLNDPKEKLSNLDLNEDNNVDYLRVVETAENNTHLIAIQAVLEKDIYQDVATIEVEKDDKGATQVQVVGDVYIYGSNYIIEPVYIHRPFIFSIFWRPYYRPYRSIYYWGYYPRYYRYWNPFRVHTYRRNVHVHINSRHTFNRVHLRRSHVAVNLHSKSRRNDYGKRYPNKSYSARVAGVKKADGTKKRALDVKQADGDRYRVGGVNKADGTKKRSAGVLKPDGTKKRIAGVNQADGDKYRTAGTTKPNGTKKRVAGVNKADGTKKRAAGVTKANGDKVRVGSVTKPNGSQKKVVGVNKSNGTKKRYSSNGSSKKKRSNSAKAKKGYNKGKKGSGKARGKSDQGKRKKKKRN